MQVHYHHLVATRESTACPRPYSLALRQQQSDRKRTKILTAARAQLESKGFVDFSLESIARSSGVTRQTIYNLFSSRSGLLEALFDQLAISGGMERMRSVMQQTDPESALADFVDVFCGFWSKDRLLIRRIHGIAAIDPEFGAAVEARNRRRQAAAARIVSMFDPPNPARITQDHPLGADLFRIFRLTHRGYWQPRRSHPPGPRTGKQSVNRWVAPASRRLWTAEMKLGGEVQTPPNSEILKRCNLETLLLSQLLKK